MGIQIIKEPRVQVITRQVFQLPEGYEGWETDAPSAGETVAEYSGRLCYLSFGSNLELSGGHKTINGRPGGNAAYLENVLKVKHGSVLEHAVWGLLVEGVSRSLTHELVRHRAGFGFSQVSQRYVDESNIAFVLPPEIEEGSIPYSTWEAAMWHALTHYRMLLASLQQDLEGSEDSKTMKKKRAQQAARAVLPNAAETKLVVTGNARAWRHFVELRGSPTADMEIRRLAVEVARALKAEAPNLFGDIEFLSHEADGTEIVHVEYSKV